MSETLEALCALLTDGTHYTPPDIGEGMPFLTVADMQPSGLNFATCSRISEAQFVEADRQSSAPKRGDVLFSKDGTVGKVHVVGGEGPFAVLSSKAIIRPDPTKLDHNYLAHFLRSPAALSAAERSKTGSALRRIILKDIRRLRLDPPSLLEQRRIAAILDQADALRRLRRDSLARVTDLRRSIFHTHQSSLNIPRQPLSMFCEKITDGTHQAPRWAESGIPFIFVSNVRNQTVSLDTEKFVSEETYRDLTRHTSIDAGDVLYTCVGSYGHAALAPSETCLFQRHIAHLKPGADRMLPEYLVELLESPGVRRQADLYATGIAQKTVTLTTLKGMQVQVPSLDQQQQVVDKLRQIKGMESQQGRMLEGANTLFASLQHRAFRGDL